MDTDILEQCYDPIVIKKSSVQQRQDLLKIMYFDESPSLTDIKSFWKNAIELLVDPIGWIAVWKLSRSSCSKFNICYPTMVVVMVENINFDKLSATVSLIVSEDYVPLSGNISDVPLRNLFPCIKQEHAIIDIPKVADILHDYRVFCNHLSYPWDDNEDWFSLHFEDRLQLYFDILTGNIQLRNLNMIKNLTIEGNDLHERIQELEEQLVDLDNGNSEDAVCDMRFLLLSQLQLELNCLSSKLTFYENKKIRNLLEKKELAEDTVDNNLVSLAWCGGSLHELEYILKALNDSLSSVKNIRFKASESLEKLLMEACEKEIIYLASATFTLKSRILLNNNNTIQCFKNDLNKKPLIVDSEEGLCLLESYAKETNLNYVELAPSNVKYVLIVCAGICNLKNVKFSQNGKTKVAINVYAGAQLVADNCSFYGYEVAIHADKDSSIALRNCSFDNNENGLEFEEATVSIDSCKFSNNKGYALLMENSDTTFMNIKKGKSVLEDFQGLKMIETTFNGNKCDMAKYY